MECTQAEQQKKNCPTDQDVHSSVLCGPNNPECAAGSKETASVAQHSLSSYMNFSVQGGGWGTSNSDEIFAFKVHFIFFVFFFTF